MIVNVSLHLFNEMRKFDNMRGSAGMLSFIINKWNIVK